MGALGFRADIQGLRAVAVLVVIIFHFNPTWLVGGFVGVDVFFVISGFLIVSILLQKKAQIDYKFLSVLKYFYESRLKRIVPAYVVMLVLVSLITSILFLPQDLSLYQSSLIRAAYFDSNGFFSDLGDYFAPANREQPLLHTWSLAVEIQFYLLAPLFILFLPVKALNWLLLSLLQEPLLSKNPVRAIRFKDIGLPHKVEVSRSYIQTNIKLQSYAEQFKGVSYLNFERSGFFSSAPFFNGELIYLDEHHLNKIGAEKYSEVARDELMRIVE